MTVSNYRLKGNEKVLIIQFRPVGDVLLTAPVARYLKKKFSNIKISYLLYEHFYPLLQNDPHIDEILLLSKGSKKGVINFIKYILNRKNIIKKIRKEKYDIILDYIGMPTSAIISYLSGVKIRVGYDKLSGRKWLYNIKAPYDDVPKYTVLRKYDLLIPLGTGEDPIIDTKLYLSEDDKEYASEYFRKNGLNGNFNIVFSPESPRDFKRWSFNCYKDLGKLLVEKYKANILIIHGPGERDYCSRLCREIGSGSILLPETTILQAAALIEKSDLAVLNCGGMKHISVAVGTPSITIFGKTSPLNWHPPELEYADYLEGKYIAGDNSFKVYPEDVLKKIDSMILRDIVGSRESIS